jgi:hypothetical protein
VPLALGVVGCGGGTPAPKPSTPPPAPAGGGAEKPATPTAEKPAEKPAEGAAAATPAGEGWGTVKGRFVLAGAAAPEPAAPTINKDQEFCGKHKIVSEEWVVNKDNKGVKWAAIWVRRPGRVHPEMKPAESVELTNEDCVFKPHVLAFQQGTKLNVTSKDGIQHNTNISSQKNPPFNPIIPAAAEGKPVVASGVPEFISEARPMPVACNIHSWMRAYIICVDNPYFAVSGDDGSFEIKNVPTGKVTLVYWHEKVADGKPQTKEIEVKAGDNDTGDWKLGG